ncbi:hypothetical protein AVEN_22883-1 [Araneus ventricosus]|uniref:Uncharacterized protein n=1 Tax=Araneus ventricosus TaxID=182803 RepID=A0A4Y2VFH5_ARAVE|nr:hypothetical protein AVEN_22883-1 [Araneus ventricosus]
MARKAMIRPVMGPPNLWAENGKGLLRSPPNGLEQIGGECPGSTRFYGLKMEKTGGEMSRIHQILWAEMERSAKKPPNGLEQNGGRNVQGSTRFMRLKMEKVHKEASQMD